MNVQNSIQDIMAIISVKSGKFTINNTNNRNTNSSNGEKDNSSVESHVTLKQILKTIRTIVAMCCVTSLIICSYFITDLYLQFNTVISTEYVKTRLLPLPAVTVCVPYVVPFTTLCKNINITDERECYEELDNRYHMSSINDFITLMTPDGRMALVQSYHTEKHLTNKSAILQIDYNYFRSSRLFCEIAKERGSYTYAGLDYFRKYLSGENKCNITRVLSLIYNYRDIGKGPQLCQTYFSKYEKDYNESKYTIDLRQSSNNMAFFKFQLLESWFPPGRKAESINVAVHPPTMIPTNTEWKYFNLKPNKSYQIEFQREVSILQPPPFKTMCINYTSAPMSRSDCIQQCVFRQSWDNKNKCFNQWNVIILRDIADKRLCPLNESRDAMYYDIRDRCEQRCGINCYDEDYDLRIEVLDDDFHLFLESQSMLSGGAFSNITGLSIRHHIGPEMIFTHSPESILSSYLANVGGLGGIFMGLNILGLYDYFTGFLKKIKKLFALHNASKKHEKDSKTDEKRRMSKSGESNEGKTISMRLPSPKRLTFKKYHSLDVIPVSHLQYSFDRQPSPIKEIV